MREPAHAGVAALVAHGDAQPRYLVIVGNDDAAFACRDLLVGIESVQPAVAERAGHFPFSSVFDHGADGFAGVLDDGEVVLSGHFHDSHHIDRHAESVHRHDGFGLLGYGAFDSIDIEVHIDGIDVYEDGLGALEDDAVGGSNEREGSRDDFVAGLQAQRPDAKVQAARSGVHRHAVFDAGVIGDGFLKFRKLRAQAQRSGLHDVRYGLDLPFRNVRRGEGNVIFRFAHF